MAAFNRHEIDAIDTAWRISTAAIWVGWAAAGDSPREVLLFRQHLRWQSLRLAKQDARYVLVDETGCTLWRGSDLRSLSAVIDTPPPDGR